MKNPKSDIPTHFESKPFLEEMGACIINGGANK